MGVRIDLLAFPDVFIPGIFKVLRKFYYKQQSTDILTELKYIQILGFLVLICCIRCTCAF